MVPKHSRLAIFSHSAATLAVSSSWRGAQGPKEYLTYIISLIYIQAAYPHSRTSAVSSVRFWRISTHGLYTSLHNPIVVHHLVVFHSLIQKILNLGSPAVPGAKTPAESVAETAANNCMRKQPHEELIGTCPRNQCHFVSFHDQDMPSPPPTSMDVPFLG